MAKVMILTDSSAYLPDEMIAGYPIQVIPLTLNWEDRSYRDGVDIKAVEFYTRLSTSDSLPSTSQISTGEFERIFNNLLDKGYDVLLLPISSGISNTFQTASSLVANFPAGRVAVLDTKLVSMALGFMVMSTARAAASGASLAECKQIAEQSYERIGVYFTVNTLKYLAAGGRINSAKRLVGSALNVKPILEIRDGKIELVSSVISRKKALDKILSLIEEDINGRTPVRISVFHALAEETALEILEIAKERFSPVECVLAEISPVVGTHTGPGTIAIAYQVGD